MKKRTRRQRTKEQRAGRTSGGLCVRGCLVEREKERLVAPRVRGRKLKGGVLKGTWAAGASGKRELE